jgi:NAD(P)-dependent dehydrogenase (short-subunit alcohol dehydrogenase family)
MAWDIDLAGNVALVSGASRGIGRAIAVALSRAGSDVIGLARSSDDLALLGSEIEEAGGRFLEKVADIAEVNTIAEVVRSAWEEAGGINILVNAAGTIVRKDPPDVTAEDWDAVFAVNARGAFFLTQAVGSRMREGAGGAVVNVASIAGEVVTRAAVSYQASKAAMIQMTRALAVRWAPKVRVNAVGPGYIRTSLNTEWLDLEENRRYVEANTPLGRVGAPDDVVGAVVFLASPAASYITGQHLKIDGGWSAL